MELKSAEQTLAQISGMPEQERKKQIEESFSLDPTVTVTLKNKPYTLEVNNYAIKGVLKDVGFNLLNEAFNRERMNDPRIMGSMLHWALKTHHPELSQDDADKLYTYRQQLYISGKLIQAIQLFLPEPKPEDTAGGQAAAAVQDPT